MPIYKIEVGNSTDGPIGMVARIRGTTPEAAVARLQGLLPEWWGSDPGEGIRDMGLDAPDEYVTVYFGGDNITVADIDPNETEEDEVVPAQP